MSTIDEVLKANRDYASSFRLASLAIPPSRRLAVLACMDARLSIEQMMGLKTGEAHIIRNAGGIVTEDALRSLVISHHLLGTQEFMIVNHTGCGMLTFQDEELRERLRRETGADPIAPSAFHSFPDVEENVRRQISRLRLHPWVPGEVTVRGFVYDVQTGKLSEVTAAKVSKGTA